MKVRLRTALLLPFVALFAAACSTNVAVDMPTIPVPVVTKYPLDVAVRIPPDFKSFVHEEEVIGSSEWSIDLGRANEVLFVQLFGHLFENLQVLSATDDPRDFTFDALIEPKIEGFEFSTPKQSQTEAFAVWVRYRLMIYDSAGNRFANWPVAAYGKSQKEGLGGSESLQRAAILAMRDAAALIVSQMEKATGLSALADGPMATPPAAEEELVAENNAKPEGLTAEDSARAVFITGLGGFKK